jgi:hypothetical protein
MDYDFGFPFEILNERKRESAVWDKEDMDTAINCLIIAFNWDMTNEGELFWLDIYNRLERIKHSGN